MATAHDTKLTDYFSSKKGSSVNPSKRRKVEIRSHNSQCIPQEVTNTKQPHNVQNNLSEEVDTRSDGRTENALFSPVQTRAARKSKSANISSTVQKPVTRRRKGQVVDPCQKLISEVLSKKKGDVPTITDDVMSAWDEHDAAVPKTPSRSVYNSETKSRKRTREEILQDAKDATPKTQSHSKDDTKSVRKSKKKLDLAADHVTHSEVR